MSLCLNGGLPLLSGKRSLASIALALLLLGCDTGGPTSDDSTEITILLAYTSPAHEAVGDMHSHASTAMRETNAVYHESKIDVRFVPVGIIEVDYTMTERLQDLERLLRPDDGHLDELHELRDTREADVVVLIAEERTATINASVLATPETAFAIVYWDGMGAPGFSLAHEVGHLQGARHAVVNDPAQEPFPYGHGFRSDELRTIMATGPVPVVPQFSGPDQLYDGVVLGDSTQANVARVLRETAAYISNFRGPQTPTDFVPPGTWPTLELNP